MSEPSPRWAAAALVVAAFAAYAFSLNAPFVFDDSVAVVRNPTITHLWPLSIPLSPPGGGTTVSGRPLLNFTFALNYAVSAGRVWSYHLFNVAIHAMAALVLWGILRRTFSGPAAWMAALIWELHPLQTEAVTCVAQRSESLMGLFYLLTLYCFVRYTEVERVDLNALSGGGVAQRVGVNALHPWAILSVLACLLGMGVKEVMVTAPVMVLLYDRTFIAGSFAAAWRKRRAYYLGLGATWLFLAGLIWREGGARGDAAGFGLGLTPWRYAVTQIWAVAHYLRQAVWPHPLVLDYGVFTVRAREVLPQAFLIAALLAGTAWALVRRPAVGFLGAWFFILLAPSSSFVPLPAQTVAEHRMYLPLAAMAAGLVFALGRAAGRRAPAICLAAAALLGGLTAARNRTFRSAEGIWRDTVAQEPGNPRAHNGLGLVLAAAGRAPAAIASYRTALDLSPDYPDALSNLGCALRQAGDFTGAAAQFRRAAAVRPDFPEVHNDWGDLLLAQGDRGGAIGHFREALRLKPDFTEAHFNLGIALTAAGDAAGAVAEYGRALQLRPDFGPAHFNLGIVLASLGRSDEAIRQFERTLAINPGDAAAENSLGNALRGAGRVGQALPHFERAADLEPNNAELEYNLANALTDAGLLAQARDRYRAALRLRPDIGRAHRNLCLILVRLGDPAGAVAEGERAAELEPRDADVRNDLGVALARTGRWAEAAEELRAAVRLRPGSAEARENLRKVLEALKK